MVATELLDESLSEPTVCVLLFDEDGDCLDRLLIVRQPAVELGAVFSPGRIAAQIIQKGTELVILPVETAATVLGLTCYYMYSASHN